MGKVRSEVAFWRVLAFWGLWAGTVAPPLNNAIALCASAISLTSSGISNTSVSGGQPPLVVAAWSEDKREEHTRQVSIKVPEQPRQDSLKDTAIGEGNPKTL